MQKQMFNIKGMVRDFDPESKIHESHAYEIRNLRLTAQEDSTLLTLTSEKGNTEYTITGDTIEGDILKGCTLNNYIVIFNHSSSTNKDYIYRLNEVNVDTPTLFSKNLYEGDLGFDAEGIDIETLTYFENDKIQKVYWIDGVHQPRMLNIMADDETIARWKTITNPFDFVTEVQLNENVTIEKNYTGGLFHSGTIQYFITYINKYAQESNIVYQSPINYISPEKRGGSPDENVINSFTITVDNIDSNFDYLRLYSVQRSSLNSTPVWKKVKDVKINENSTQQIGQIEKRAVQFHNFTEEIDSLDNYTQTEDAYLEVVDAEFTTNDYEEVININKFFVNNNLYRTSQKYYPDDVSSPDESYNHTTSGYIMYVHTGRYLDNKEIVQKIIPTSDNSKSSEYSYITSLEKYINCVLDINFTYTKEGLLDFYLNKVSGSFYSTYGFLTDEIHTGSVSRIIITDTNSGDIIDNPLYLNTEIVPKTLANKDTLLFLGNYTTNSTIFSEEEIETIKGNINIGFTYKDTIAVDEKQWYDNYDYLQYNDSVISTFKGGEVYSFGIVFQDNKGVWTPVIPLGDYKNELYPHTTKNSYNLVQAVVSWNDNVIFSRYKRIKIVVKEKTSYSRIAQGILFPTMFNTMRDQDTGGIYAMSSWFARGIRPWVTTTEYNPLENPINIEYSNAGHLWPIDQVNEKYKEFPVTQLAHPYRSDASETAVYKTAHMFVDWTMLDFYSPDINLSEISTISPDAKLEIVGIVPIQNTAEANKLVFKDTSVTPSIIRDDGATLNYTKIKRMESDDIPKITANYNNQLTPWFTVNLNNGGTNIPIKSNVWSKLRYSINSRYINNTNFIQYDIKSPVISGDLIDTKYVNGKLYASNINQLSLICNDTTNNIVPFSFKTEKHLTVEMPSINNIISTVPNINTEGQPISDIAGVKILDSKYAVEGEIIFNNTYDNTLHNHVTVDKSYPMVLSIRGSVADELNQSSVKTGYYYYIDVSGVIENEFANIANLEKITRIQRRNWITDVWKCTGIKTVGGNSWYTFTRWDISEVYNYWGRKIKTYGGSNGFMDTGNVSYYLTPTGFNFPFLRSLSGNKEIKGPILAEGVHGSYDGSHTYPLSEIYHLLLNTYFNVNSVNDRIAESRYTSGCTELDPVEVMEKFAVCFPNIDNTKCYETYYYKIWYNLVSFHTYDGYGMHGTYKGDYYFNSPRTTQIGLSNGSYTPFYCNRDLMVKDGVEGQCKVYNMPENPIVFSSDKTNDGDSWDYYVNNLTEELVNLSNNHQILNRYNYIYLVDLVENPLSESFNKETDKWNIAGESYKISDGYALANIGDTYYQRYDCLKCQPYSEEDINKVTDIVSFMCETRINVAGTYNTNKSLINNEGVRISNFNQLNTAYNQLDNIYTYAWLNTDLVYTNERYNEITWTLNKVSGSILDNWTKILSTANLALNGTLGNLSALRLWNDNLIGFQDSGISRINYNDRTTISTTQGVPIEIAQSAKVDGYTLISNHIGCKNKHSIKTTKESIYFIDSNTRELYKWSGTEAPISLSKGKGFNTYFYNKNININTEKTFYDPILKDLYFRINNAGNIECLVFNEQLGEFTSFFDYDMDDLFTINSNLIALRQNKFYKQFDGDYLKYFNNIESKAYSIEFIANQNPIVDKIFTNIELRADVLLDKSTDAYSQSVDTNAFNTNPKPFTTIRVWNEYQDTGKVDLSNDFNGNFVQKFRIWRGDIPRVQGNPIERIRNTWSRFKLEGTVKPYEKTLIHDLAVLYI